MIRKGCLYGLGCLVFLAVLPFILEAAFLAAVFLAGLGRAILAAI